MQQIQFFIFALFVIDVLFAKPTEQEKFCKPGTCFMNKYCRNKEGTAFENQCYCACSSDGRHAHCTTQLNCGRGVRTSPRDILPTKKIQQEPSTIYPPNISPAPEYEEQNRSCKLCNCFEDDYCHNKEGTIFKKCTCACSNDGSLPQCENNKRDLYNCYVQNKKSHGDYSIEPSKCPADRKR